MKTRALLLLLACSAAACESSPAGPDPRFVITPSCSRPAPLHGQPDSRIPDQYIVVFKDGVNAPATASSLAAEYGFQTRYVWEHALLGFSAVMSKEAVAGVRCESSIKYIAFDAVITIDD